MDLPNIYTEKTISPAWQVNKRDIKKVIFDGLIFFAAPILIYLGQLIATLQINHILYLTDFIPTIITIGAIEGWVLNVGINFFLKLKDGTH